MDLPDALTFVQCFALLALLVAAMAAEVALVVVARGKARLGQDSKAARTVQQPAAAIAGLRAIWVAAATGLIWLMARDMAAPLAVAVGFLLILLLSALARLLGAARASRVLGVTLPLCQIARPIGMVVLPLAAGMGRLSGGISTVDQQQADLRDELAGAIALGHSGGAMEKADRDRLLGALDLSDRTVAEIMRHRRQIEMIDAAAPPAEIIRQMLASPHSRLPVFRDDEENIVGVVHTKELLREVDRLIRGDDRNGEGETPEGLQALDILKVAMKPYFIPETTALDDQIRAFLARRTHFALVVDEYGGLKGLITLEDILEEIVGDITDEFDVISRNSGLKQDANGDFLVDGAMTIRDLNRATDWHLPDDEANTIAGLVIHEAQMIPVAGQVFNFHGFRFEVAERRENRLTKLRMRPT